ncbi:MAG: prolyl oligopeptidase family serine peptidase [Planctomycetes bacterium]|nr:prolyl oligopeptidase family serine peptidase [Planctomycetota bacterium]
MTALLWAILAQADAGLTRREWKVEDVSREALLHLPARDRKSPAAAPVVFAFHGHGGTARNAAAKFRLHKLWPEAIVVYMQGLPTPGMTDPEGRKPGWQKQTGDQGDRDLKFFDAVLATLRKDHSIDEDRVYATGHSNGGGFTYLLWSSRADVFAAFAPSAAAGRNARDLAPKPALHVAGEKDTVVPFEAQKKAMEAVRESNGCEEKGEEWDKGCLIYASKKDAPFVSFIHPGDHTYAAEAPALIVRFFKGCVRKK